MPRIPVSDRRLAGLWSACLCLPLLASCGPSEQSGLKGYLYFAAGSYLAVFNLKTGKADPVFGLGDLRIDEVSAMKDELLLSVTPPQSGMNEKRVLRFDPARGGRSEFMVGAAARYLPDADVLLYDNGEALLAVPRNDVTGTPVILHQHEQGFPIEVLLLDGVQILVGFNREDKPAIARIDVSDGSSEILLDLSSKCDLAGALWITDQARLLCKAPRAFSESSEYHMVSLDGKSDPGSILPEGSNFRALTYLPEEHQVIFTQTWTGWMDQDVKHAVWLYDLHSGENLKLADDQNLGSSAVYRQRQY